MTNADAIAAITAAVNERLLEPIYEAGPPASWSVGAEKRARLMDVSGLLLYTLGDGVIARPVHAGVGKVTESDVARVAQAIFAELQSPG